MRVEEFKKKTNDELTQMANDCFAEMQGTSIQVHPALLLKAQMYLKEIDDRHDAKIVRRDLILELVIITLIIFEVAFAVYEGVEQARIFDQMSSNIAATAGSLKELQTAQDKSIVEQMASLDSLNHMNTNLQKSVNENSEMVLALQNQLKILQDEQNSKLAELARKPKLALYVGQVLLDPQYPIQMKPKQESDTTSTYEFSLRNDGDAPARNGVLRVIANAKDISLSSSSPTEPILEPADTPYHVILIPFKILRATGSITLSVTVSFPKNHAPFVIAFNADADEISTATVLGIISVKPPQGN